MSIEKVKAYFKGFGIEGQILEFDVSSATVELAAQALGCMPQRIAKTLSFLVDGNAVLVVAAGDRRRLPIRGKGRREGVSGCIVKTV